MFGREVLWLLAVADDVDGLRRRGLMTPIESPVKGGDLACHETPGYRPRAGRFPNHTPAAASEGPGRGSRGQGWASGVSVAGYELGLRAGGTGEGRRVPAGVHRDLLHVQPGLRGVDDVAVADVDGDVTDAVVVEQVARLDGRGGDVRQRGPLLVGVARDRDPGRRPGRLGQTGSVEAARPGRAPL